MPSERAKRYTSDIIRGIMQRRGGRIKKGNLEIKVGSKNKNLIVNYNGDRGDTTGTVEKKLKQIFGVNPYNSLTINSENGEVQYGYEIMFELLPSRQKEQNESRWVERINQILSS